MWEKAASRVALGSRCPFLQGDTGNKKGLGKKGKFFHHPPCFRDINGSSASLNIGLPNPLLCGLFVRMIGCHPGIVSRLDIALLLLFSLLCHARQELLAQRNQGVVRGQLLVQEFQTRITAEAAIVVLAVEDIT